MSTPNFSGLIMELRAEYCWSRSLAITLFAPSSCDCCEAIRLISSTRVRQSTYSASLTLASRRTFGLAPLPSTTITSKFSEDR